MVTLSDIGYDTTGMSQEEVDELNSLLENYEEKDGSSDEKAVYDVNQRFVRNPEIAELATNTKESYELLAELFAGNDLYEQDKISRDVKLTKMIDLI